jgi:hypothetical protein
MTLLSRSSAPFLLTLMLLVGACAGGGASETAVDVEVRPFSEIQDGEVTFEADPTDPRRGIFRVTNVPETEPEPDLGPNLAVDATIAEVSSEFNDAFAAANAIDGDLSTEWSSREDGDDAFITVDLAAPTPITGVAFLTRSMADGSAITEEYTVTTDGGEVLGPFPAGTPAQARVSQVDVTATTLRFEVVRSTGGNVGAVEIQVFGG